MNVYYGHHKCASTWIRGILEQIFRESGHRFSMVVDPMTPHASGDLTDYRETFSRMELSRYVTDRDIDFLSCITADAEHATALEGVRGFHVIRDPRDIIVSGYFSHRNSHPTDDLPHLEKHRTALQSVSKAEGLFLEMDFSARCLQDIGGWDYDREEILEIKMEELTSRPYEGFIDIFEFLDLMSWDSAYRMQRKIQRFSRTAANRLAFRYPVLDGLRQPTKITGEMLLGRVYDHRFEKKTGGREKGEVNVNSHYRKGVAGDWVNHFSREHAEYFLDQFGEILIQTGYEPDAAWVAACQDGRVAVPAGSDG